MGFSSFISVKELLKTTPEELFKVKSNMATAGDKRAYQADLEVDAATAAAAAAEATPAPDAGVSDLEGDAAAAPAETAPASDAGVSTETHSIAEGDAADAASVVKEGDGGEEKNPWSRSFIGIPINYFSVGLVYGGSVSILFPVLIIQNGVTSSFFSAAVSLVTVFWSYKIFFGMLSDFLPIMGRKWKWYIVIGWILCAAVLVGLAG